MDATELKRVARSAKDGRTLYRARGILPWAAFEDGRIPSHQWWSDPAFVDAVQRWQLEALTDPSEEPQPDPKRARQEALQATFEPIVGDLSKLHKQLFSGALKSLNLRLSLPDPAKVRERILRDHGIEPWSPPLKV